MKPILFLLILWLFCANAYGQPDSLQRKGPPLIPRQYTAIKPAFLNLVDLLNPNLAFAVEKRFHPKNAVQGTFGLTLPLQYRVDGITGTSHGVKLRLEYRRYYSRKPNNKDWFLAGEVFYTGYRTGGTSLYEDTVGYAKYGRQYSDEVIVSKKMGGAAVRIGIQKRFRKRFLFEFNGGVGFKYRDVEQTGRFNTEHPLAIPHHPYIPNISNARAKENAVVFPANFFLGYLLY